MRIRIHFNLDKNELPLDMHSSILHFIKTAVSEYDKDLFNELYNGNKRKRFSFSMFLPEAKFYKNHIELSKETFFVTFTTGDYALGLKLVNAFMLMKNKKIQFGKTTATCSDLTINTKMEQIHSNCIIVKFISPLVIKSFNEAHKNYNYSVRDDNFTQIFETVVNEQLKLDEIDERVSINLIKAKDCLVKAFDGKISASNGIFALKGSPSALTNLYLNGCGSKRSSGFGMFDIIEEL